MFSLEIDCDPQDRDMLIAELWEQGSAGIVELNPQGSASRHDSGAAPEACEAAGSRGGLPRLARAFAKSCFNSATTSRPSAEKVRWWGARWRRSNLDLRPSFSRSGLVF